MNETTKVKTSVTLSRKLLRAIDRTGRRVNRSEFIEKAAWTLIERKAKAERDARDLEILNANADDLNAEALDVLEYQDLG
ncbi:MAG: hypothetical protein AB1714_18410 [Acidobacteriota bacterium]